MDGGYVYLRGAQPRWATLIFRPQAAQWVSREEWHPRQAGRWLQDGCYELKVPYVDETEDRDGVLRHGEQVVVTGPEGPWILWFHGSMVPLADIVVKQRILRGLKECRANRDTVVTQQADASKRGIARSPVPQSTQVSFGTSATDGKAHEYRRLVGPG